MSKKDMIFKEEMKAFNIEVDDIQPSNDILTLIDKAIIKMRENYITDRLEVILNNNLIESKDKITNYRTILGCRVSYGNLPKDVSFVVRLDEKPSYEKLEDRYNKLQSNWNSLREYIQEEIITSKNIGDQHWFYYQIVLDEMNELEGVDNENN